MATIYVGAFSHNTIEWHAIDWQKVNVNVRRLQARIVKAVKENRWGKVKALQRLLTHSFSAKALAVRRVTENTGKRTPGVDAKIWDTPEKKAAAIINLKQHGYLPLPLKRIYIPKSNGKMRPLSIPVMHDRAMQALYLLGLDPHHYPKVCILLAIRKPSTRDCSLSIPRHKDCQPGIPSDLRFMWPPKRPMARAISLIERIGRFNLSLSTVNSV